MVTNGEWNKYVLKHPLIKKYISKKEMKETKIAVSLEEPSPTIITCFKIKTVCAICKVITLFAYNR
jgi:hypothetical protein